MALRGLYNSDGTAVRSPGIRKGIVITLAAAAIAIGLPLCAGVSFAGSGSGGSSWGRIFANDSGGGNCDFGNVGHQGDDEDDGGYCQHDHHHDCDHDDDGNDANGDDSNSNCFETGDIMVSTFFGDVLVYNSAGTLKQTLSPTGTNQPVLNGEGFDLNGNLYVAEFSPTQDFMPTGTVFKYSPSAQFRGTFGTGYVANVESLTFDSKGDVFTGSPGDTFTVGGVSLALIREFDANGNPLTSVVGGASYPGFLVQPDMTGSADGGADYVAMGTDNCTLYYANEGNNIQTYNVCTQTQGGVFNKTPMTDGVFEMVALPASMGGGLLATGGNNVVQLDSHGSAVKTFTLPGSIDLYAISLDPSGKSFWVGDIVDGEVAEIDLSTGNVLTSFNGTPNPPAGYSGGVAGLSVDGAPQAIVNHDCSENGDEHSGQDGDSWGSWSQKSGWFESGDHDDNSGNGNCYGHDQDYDHDGGGW